MIKDVGNVEAAVHLDAQATPAGKKTEGGVMALRTEALHHIEPFKLQGMKEGHPFSWEDEHAYGRAASSKDLAADTKTYAGPARTVWPRRRGRERERN